MTNYTWKIHTLTKQTVGEKEEVVVSVVWEKYGVDEDLHYGSFKAATNFEISSFDSFIDYKDLKESDVIGWILNDTSDEYINEKINEQIEISRTHKVVIEDGNFPWS